MSTIDEDIEAAEGRIAALAEAKNLRDAGKQLEYEEAAKTQRLAGLLAQQGALEAELTLPDLEPPAAVEPPVVVEPPAAVDRFAKIKPIQAPDAPPEVI